MKCEDCKWWMKLEDDNPRNGECRRKSPSPSPKGIQYVGYWPLTANCDYCGEYKPKGAA